MRGVRGAGAERSRCRDKRQRTRHMHQLTGQRLSESCTMAHIHHSAIIIYTVWTCASRVVRHWRVGRRAAQRARGLTDAPRASPLERVTIFLRNRKSPPPDSQPHNRVHSSSKHYHRTHHTHSRQNTQMTSSSQHRGHNTELARTGLTDRHSHTQLCRGCGQTPGTTAALHASSHVSSHAAHRRAAAALAAALLAPEAVRLRER